MWELEVGRSGVRESLMVEGSVADGKTEAVKLNKLVVRHLGWNAER